MNRLFTMLMPALLMVACQQAGSRQNGHAQLLPAYDSALARKAGADSFGMRTYIFCYLKKGPNRSQSKEEAAKIQAGHMANIGRLAQEGKLVLAGPFLDTGVVRGIFIFNTSSLEEAKSWTESDPAVRAGRLVMELHPWYGSAALMLMDETYQKIKLKEH